MVAWTNLCRSPASSRLNPALQQYYAEETEEFFTNLANGLDNLVVTLGPDSVRVEWLELAISFLRTTHSEVQVLLDKLKHYASVTSKTDPDWLHTYLDETAKLLDVCTRLKPGLLRIERYHMCVELASRALSKLNLDAIQADLRRCLYRASDGSAAAKPAGPPDEDPALLPTASSSSTGSMVLRKRNPPSRESFEFPVSGSPAMETSPVMPSSPTLEALDACRKADKLIQSIERMNLNTTSLSPSKTTAAEDGRIDLLTRDALVLKSQYVALDFQGSGGDDSGGEGLEDLESLVAEAEKLLYMRRPGSLSEPPPPPPGMFNGLPLPTWIPRDSGSPLRPFKLDCNFKIDISPSKSSDTSASNSPHSSGRRRSSEMRTGAAPRKKPPVYPHSDRGSLDAAAKDTRQVSGEAEPGGAGGSSCSHSRQGSAEVEALGSIKQHSRQVSIDSISGVVTLEQISAPLVAQFEASLCALRECKQAISREWRSGSESQKLIVDPLQPSPSRSGLSGSFTRYFRHRTSSESSRRKSSGEGSKLAQFLETLTADRTAEDDEERQRRASSDGLSTISLSAWVEKGTAHAMSPIREGKEGQVSESPIKHNVRDVKKLAVVIGEPVADAKLLPWSRDSTDEETTAPADSPSQSRRGLFYGAHISQPGPSMSGAQQEKHEDASPAAKRGTTNHASVSLSGKKGKQTPARRRSQSLDDVATERLHTDNLVDAPEREPSPSLGQDGTSPQGREDSNNSKRSETRGPHRRSASFDRLKPYGKGGWRSERTDAILRAYQDRSRALPPSPHPTVEILPFEDGKKGTAHKVERVDVSEGASLSRKFPEEAPSQLARVGEGVASVPDGQAQSSATLRRPQSESSFYRASEQPSSASRNPRAQSLAEARHLRPLGGHNVASIVAKFESFFDAEFETKHDIKTAGSHGSRDLSADVEAKMKVYDNPLHRAGPLDAPPAALVKVHRKSASPSRLWRISGAGFDSSVWRRSASESPTPSRRSKEHDSKDRTRMVSSVSPRKRERSKSTSSPGRLNLFSQVKHWVSHHHHGHGHGHGHDHDHEGHHTTRSQESPKSGGSSGLRRSRSSNISKPNSPSHSVLKSPGRLSMNLVTIQRGASSLVKNFGHVAMKQCTNPAAGTSRWSGLGGVFLATRASTGVVSSFLVWVLGRTEAGDHPSRLDYTITKSEFHWAVSLKKLQEKVGKFDKERSARISADTRSSFASGASDAIAADSHTPPSSSEGDRKGRRRWSLEWKPRRSSSEYQRQDGGEVEESRTGRPSSHEDPQDFQSGQPGMSHCLHIQELKEMHDCVEELYVGLESLFSSCQSALGKNRAELEQLPQEKIIRECVPSESSSDPGTRRRLFDKGQGDAVPARPIQVERNAQALQMQARQKPGEEPVVSLDSPVSDRRRSSQTRQHHVSYSGSSFAFELDNSNEELRSVEAIFVEWRSGKMARAMRRLQQCTEEFRGSLETVSREVDELFAELESGRRTLMD